MLSSIEGGGEIRIGRNDLLGGGGGGGGAGTEARREGIRAVGVMGHFENYNYFRAWRLGVWMDLAL